MFLVCLVCFLIGSILSLEKIYTYITQDTNARKVISEVYAFFVLQCSVLSLGGKLNTRRMSQPAMESIFTKIVYEILQCEISKLPKLNALILLGY